MLYRGCHPLPHQSQVLGRDLCGEQIRRNPGAVAHAYRLTDDQEASGRWHYRYTVSAPNHPALAWTAFHTEAAFRAWLDAYGLAIDGLPGPGDHTTITLPDSNASWAPLSELQT